ncbi:MAG TPA: efflux RND transporter periplasmic adaptor subunit [Chiayiivirga sp.]|nr:efflux RND transporter periplasmic adaptor subunit [Chiayiivirga sp.]
MRHALRSSLVIGLMALTGCSAHQDEAVAPLAPPALALHTVSARAMPSLREWDGRIEAIDQVTLAAQTGGRVTDLAVDVGDVMEEGAVLLRFTAVEQKAGQRQALAALEAARANASEADANVRRIEDVYARRLLAKSELDRATAANEAAQAQLAAARAGLKSADERVGYTAIRAPYRGVVTARHVEAGETVAAGQRLVSGMSLDRLRLVVDVPHAVARRLHAETPAFVVDVDGRRVKARHMMVFPQADPRAHTVTVRLDLPEREPGFTPGQSAKAAFEIDEVPVTAVPISAISQRGEVSSVFVLDAAGRVGLRQIRLGRTLDNDEMEVLAGLVAGERIASDANAGLVARREQRTRMRAH